MTSLVFKILEHYSGILSKFFELPRIEVNLLLRFILHSSFEYLHVHSTRQLSAHTTFLLKKLLIQRIKGKPINYMVGIKNFWCFSLKTKPSVFIPRQNTESIVDIICRKFFFRNKLSILDLGTGSGVIALALAKEHPNWKITSVDSSILSLMFAKKNAMDLRINSITFIKSDAYKSLSGKKFDVVISNPPYIANGDPFLDYHVTTHEPGQALFSTNVGLNCTFHILQNAIVFLKEKGFIIVEHGYQQRRLIHDFFDSNSYEDVTFYDDTFGNKRAVSGYSKNHTLYDNQ